MIGGFELVAPSKEKRNPFYGNSSAESSPTLDGMSVKRSEEPAEYEDKNQVFEYDQHEQVNVIIN
jgi:hypothetical protein